MTSTVSHLTPSEYIVHHLKHFSTKYQGKIVDFSILNIDTIFWAIFCGIVVCCVMYMAVKQASIRAPGRFLALIEILVEIVENQSKAIIHGDRRFIAPLGLTIFLWIVLMNSLDFLPVDLISGVMHMLNLDYMPYHRIVPTADLNGTLGIALGILSIVIYYNFKIKGVFRFLYELLSTPFGLLLAPINLLINIIEFFAKTVSLGMRLFGNIYAGELLFVLIALLGSSATFFGFIGHVIAGSIWAIFHILIVVLQAFIFMMLTLVYLGQVHESH